MVAGFVYVWKQKENHDESRLSSILLSSQLRHTHLLCGLCSDVHLLVENDHLKFLPICSGHEHSGDNRQQEPLLQMKEFCWSTD